MVKARGATGTPRPLRSFPEPADSEMGEMKYTLERDGDLARLSLEGEVDMRLAPRLRSLMHEILDDRPSRLVVDLASVPFIDSSGVATLVEALRMQMEAGRSLQIVNPSDPVYYTFKITQLTKVFGMDNPEEVAP